VNETARVLQRAVLLAEAALVYGDPGILNTRFDRLAKFNAADVQRVAKAYLTRENRTVIVTMPKSATPGDQVAHR